MRARALLTPRSNCRRRRARAHVGIAAALVLVLVLPGLGRAQGIWDQLSPQEQQTVLTKVRDQLRADLAADESVLPEFSDPRLKAAANAMLGPDTAELAKYAGELSAGEYDRAINAGLDAAANQLAQYLLERVKGRLPEDSAARVYLEYAAGKGDALKAIGKAAFDDTKSWSDFAEVTWTELNKAAAEDVQAAAEDVVKRTLDFALGEGSLPGLSPGEVYLEILKAEVVLLETFEVASVRLAANNLYQEYRRERDAGATAFFAWDNVYTTMIGSSGVGEVASALRSGTTEELRLGFYVLRHVDADTLARRFEECYQGNEDPCTVQVETAAAQQQAEADRWVKAKVAEMKAEILGDTREALIGRDQIRSLYAHIGDSLRREMMAVYQATESQQQGMREARYTAEARLGRIRQLALDVAARCQEFDSIEAQARSTLGYFNSLDGRVADVERLMSQARRCGTAGGGDDTALTDLAARREGLVATADQASTAACSWNDPTTAAEAREVLRQALSEASRTTRAAGEARDLAERLRAAAAAAPAGQVDPETRAARQALQDMLPVLDEAARTAANVINLRASMRDHAVRGDQQYDVGMEWLRELDAAVAPFRGMPEFDRLRDEAQRLMGAGAYGELDDTVLSCSARMQARLGAFEREARPDGASLEANRDVLARWRSQAEAALGACSEGTDGGIDATALVAAADADDARLGAFIDAAALCAGRAQRLRDELIAAEQQADDDSADPAAGGGADRDADADADADRTGSGDEEGGELWIAARIFMPDNLPGMLGGLQEEGADPQQVLDRARQTLRDTDPAAVSWTSENTGEVFIRVSPEQAAAVREQLRDGDRFSVGVGLETAAAGGLDIEGSMLMEAAGAFSSRDELVAAFPDFDPGQLVDLDASGSGSMRSGSGDGAMTVSMGDIEGGWSDSRQQEAIGLMADAMTTFVAAAMDPASGLATEDCFVATAVYGDVAAPELTPLRRFRDRVLLTHPAGRDLVRFYYRQGPGWADWARERPAVRAGLRTVLDLAGPLLGGLEPDDLLVRWSRPLLRLGAWLTDQIEAR